MKKRIISLFAAIVMLAGVFGSAISAAAVVLHSGDPAKDGYVSMHQYVSPTDDPKVFKITHTIVANIKKPAVFITFVLDESTSMDRVDVYDPTATVTPPFVSRRAAVVDSLNSALDFLKSDEAAKKVNRSDIYINMIGHARSSPTPKQYTGAASQDGNYMGFVGAYDATGKIWNPDLAAAVNNYNLGRDYSSMINSFKGAYDALEGALQYASGDPLAPANSGVNNLNAARMKDISIADATKYVLILGDGDLGMSTRPTILPTDPIVVANYAAAMKMPMDIDPLSGFMIPAGDTNSTYLPDASIFNNPNALGATIWTTVFGADAGHKTNWKSAAVGATNILTSYPGTIDSSTYWVNTANGNSASLLKDNYRVVEPFMVAAAVPVTTNIPGGYGSLAYTAKNSWPLSLQDSVDDFRQVNENISSAANAKYFWVQHVNNDGPITNAKNTTDLATTDVTAGVLRTVQKRMDYESEDGVKTFEDFVESAMPTFTPTATAKLANGVTITSVPGYPLYTLSSEDGSPAGSATLHGKNKIDWNPTLDPNIEYKLEYFVKLDDSLSPDYYHSLVDLSFQINDGSKTHGPMTFSSVYVRPGTGESTKDEAVVEAEVVAVDEKTTSTIFPAMVVSGAEVPNKKPEIGKITSSVSKKTGRTVVKVDVKNNGDFSYQWQYLDESGKWIDIFGANSSVYYLGNPLKAGQTYTLRCVVKNQAGTKFNSDEIKVKVTSVTKLYNEELKSNK